MNKLLLSFTLALVTACPMPGFGQSSLEEDPAYLPIDKVLDFKTIRPEVNINLPRFLLQDVASELDGGPNDPLAGTGINFAELIKDIKLIRVVVIEATEETRAALEKGVKSLRATLESKWTPIVVVPEENVGVYALSDPSGQWMAGIAVLISDDGEAVIANVVGRVSIAKILKIASSMDKFPKDLLKKLGAGGLAKEDKPPTEAKPAAK